jgi:hypothetical protein
MKAGPRDRGSAPRLSKTDCQRIARAVVSLPFVPAGTPNRALTVAICGKRKRFLHRQDLRRRKNVVIARNCHPERSRDPETLPSKRSQRDPSTSLGMIERHEPVRQKSSPIPLEEDFAKQICVITAVDAGDDCC